MNRHQTEQIHATCIALDGHGVLLQGPPGSGKSDLALRLLEAGAALVADDRVDLVREDDRLRASAPVALRGLIEVRGLGVLRHPAIECVSVALLCDLSGAEIARMPDMRHLCLLGVDIPVVAVAPFEASAGIKVQLALKLVTGSIMRAHDPI